MKLYHQYTSLAVLVCLLMGFSRICMGQPFSIRLGKNNDNPPDVAFAVGITVYKLGMPRDKFLDSFGPPDWFDGSDANKAIKWRYLADGVTVDFDNQGNVSAYTFCCSTQGTMAAAKIEIPIDPAASMRRNYFTAMPFCDAVLWDQTTEGDSRTMDLICGPRQVSLKYANGSLQEIVVAPFPSSGVQQRVKPIKSKE